MASISPYLTFAGNCEEAFQFYQDHLWMREFGEGLCVYKPAINTKTTEAIMNKRPNGNKELALNWITGIPLPALVLAFAPGGLAEMSLIALALGVDAAFVSTHHIVRIVLIVSLVPLTFRAFRRFERRRHPESD